jgi:hypothetical protein
MKMRCGIASSKKVGFAMNTSPFFVLDFISEHLVRHLNENKKKGPSKKTHTQAPRDIRACQQDTRESSAPVRTGLFRAACAQASTYISGFGCHMGAPYGLVLQTCNLAYSWWSWDYITT